MSLTAKQINEAIRTYSDQADKNPQCYESSHALHRLLEGKESEKIEFDAVNKKALASLYSPCLGTQITTVELKICSRDKLGADAISKIRKKYKISKFFVPRLFLHSFIIIRTPTKVFIAQSWFRAMNLRIIYSLSRPKFVKWLDALRANVRGFRTHPQRLFMQFKYTRPDIRGLLKFVHTDVKGTSVALELWQ